MPKTKTISAAVATVIDAIGARGDGIAETPAGRIYVPFSAPGDRLRVRIGGPRGEGSEARIERVLTPGPDRVDAVCGHFGTCGGCALQHLRGEAIATIKRDLLRSALSRRGLGEAPEQPTVTVPPGRRRRARFTVRRAARTILGFNERGSHRVFDMGECPALRPEITALIGPLRALCAPLDALGRAAEVQITLTDTGLDLLFVPARPAKPDLAAREALAGFADAHDLCRVAWESHGVIEPIAARRSATMRFGEAAVTLPPGAFLQPSKEGEAAIVNIVTRAVAESGTTTAADFYAGCGALTFPLARIAAVHAVEGDAAMVAAVRHAARHRPVTVEQRDLARDPPSPAELDHFGAVIFDPPRAGARSLAQAFAQSRIPRILAVSCNPATLARDLRILVDGGYRIERVVPIDQFAWSAHVEAVAVLDRCAN